MGRKLSYQPGSFYRVDDRTGFAQRAERTRKQWNSLIVDESVWEPRQPQDLVRGVKDQQNVPDARPDAPATFDGPTFTQLSAAVGAGAYLLPVDSVFGLNHGEEITVMLASGDAFLCFILWVFTDTSEVLISQPLAGPAPSGNLITDFHIQATGLVAYLATEAGDILATESGLLLELDH